MRATEGSKANRSSRTSIPALNSGRQNACVDAA